MQKKKKKKTQLLEAVLQEGEKLIQEGEKRSMKQWRVKEITPSAKPNMLVVSV